MSSYLFHSLSARPEKNKQQQPHGNRGGTDGGERLSESGQTVTNERPDASEVFKAHPSKELKVVDTKTVVTLQPVVKKKTSPPSQRTNTLSHSAATVTTSNVTTPESTMSDNKISTLSQDAHPHASKKQQQHTGSTTGTMSIAAAKKKLLANKHQHPEWAMQKQGGPRPGRPTTTTSHVSNASTASPIPVTMTSSHVSVPQIGAHRVVGIDGRVLQYDDDEEDGFTYSNVANPNRHQLPAPVQQDEELPAIVAETVPELVSARAVPEELLTAAASGGASDGGHKETSGCRRRTVVIAVMVVVVIVAILVGVLVGVLFGDDDTTDTTTTTTEPPPGGTTTTTPETVPPTSSPTPLMTERLFTTFNYTHFFYGHMFDITAKRSFDVVSMGVHMWSTGLEDVEVYTKQGTFHGYETDHFRWSRIGEARIQGLGVGKLTPLPRDMFDPPVRVAAGTTRAFLITCRTNQECICFQERFDLFGVASLIDYGETTEFTNSVMEINVGTGVQYPFQNYGPPNVFNGEVEYRVVGN